MIFRITKFLCVLIFFASNSSYANDLQDAIKKQSPFKLSYTVNKFENEKKIKLNWKMDAGCYIYKNRISITSVPKINTATFLNNPKVQFDKNFGEYVQIFFDELSIELGAPKELTSLKITIQGCSKMGVCYLPQTEIIKI